MSTQKLKLTIGPKSSFSSASALSANTPIVATPGGSRPKLTFKTNSTPSTPAPAKEEVAPKPTQTKAGRVPKATAKVRESKKRIKEESDTEDEGSTIQVQPPPAKRFKVTIGSNSAGPSPSSAVPKTPLGAHLKVKVKGKPPKRELGEGYDSEASDREDDPTIEEQFVLRMVPGDDCDYLRQAIAEKRIGIPKIHGGPDIYMKFYADDQNRRALINIRGRAYAAIMVDLPCVIEGMKSWDKRGWWKSADICQMLWVYKAIDKEEEAKTLPLPKSVDPKTYQYPHGLTPPMHYARKRRFRKRISRTAIEAVEDAVEKLLAADAAAEVSNWEMIEPDNRGSIFSGMDSEQEYDDEEDAEGEVDDPRPDYFSNIHHTSGGEVQPLAADDADLEADLEAAFEEVQSIVATPMSTTDATPMINTETPVAEAEEEEDSGDDSVEGDDDEEETGGIVEVDEDAKARQMERQGILDEIADLERSLEVLHQNLANQVNPILKRRLQESIRKTMTELELKRASLEEADD